MPNQLGYIHLTDTHEIAARWEATRLNREEYLDEMARCLNEDYFRTGLDIPHIHFVFGLTRTYGIHKLKFKFSGTMLPHEIRINHRMAIVEEWIVEVLVMHELAHILQPNHGRNFWILVNRHPNAAQAEQILNAGAPVRHLADSNFTTRGWDFTNYPEYNLENHLTY